MTEKRRYNATRIFGNILWAFLGMATVVLLGAAISLKNNKHCKGVNINISGTQNNFFIDKKEIGNILETLCGGTLTGKTLGSFNLSSIENKLKKDQWIKNAELFFDNNEVLMVNVTERSPVARIFTSAGSSFYIDTDIAMLPLSEKYSARVPVFTNFTSTTLTKPDSSLLNDIKNIGDYILNDPFWMAQIEQIDINANRTFEMIPKVGNQIIVFGDAENYQQKFNNLLAFYKKVVTKIGWNKYSKINLSYKEQIVAVKRDAEDILQDSLRVKQIMQSLVINAQKQATDSISNIQLDQQKDDNNIPVAVQLDNLPDEAITKFKPVNTTSEKIIENPAKKTDSIVVAKPLPVKALVTQKKSPSVEKPFWLKPSAATPFNALKNSASAKNKVEKSNSKKRLIVLNSAATKKTIYKPVIKTINKPTIKPTNTIKEKPKAVMPPKNDY